MKEGIDYRYNYLKNETPVERLRNKLSGIFVTFEVLSNHELPPLLGAMVKNSKEELSDVRILLDDAEKCEC